MVPLTGPGEGINCLNSFCNMIGQIFFIAMIAQMSIGQMTLGQPM